MCPGLWAALGPMSARARCADRRCQPVYSQLIQPAVCVTWQCFSHLGLYCLPSICPAAVSGQCQPSERVLTRLVALCWRVSCSSVRSMQKHPHVRGLRQWLLGSRHYCLCTS